MEELALQNIEAVLEGKDPLTPVVESRGLLKQKHQ